MRLFLWSPVNPNNQIFDVIYLYIYLYSELLMVSTKEFWYENISLKKNDQISNYLLLSTLLHFCFVSFAQQKHSRL